MRRRLVTTMVLGLAAAWTATAAAQQSAEERFQAALYQEEVQGDLKGAIAAYQRVLREHAENRAVAAKAQLHIGLCYEKLGLGDARRAYLGVIDGFPEQADVVAMAQRRLASLAHELDELRRQPTFTKIEIASKPQNGVLSADGQRLAFVDQGALWVVPLHGNVDPTIAGGPVRIAEAPGIWDYWSQMAWSADGQWIAVNSGGNAENTVDVLPVGGGDPRTIQMPPRRGHAWSYRISLSPDGQTLAFSAVEPGRETGSTWDRDRLFTIPTEGGEPEQMTSFWSNMPAFSPDGKFIAFVGYRERSGSRDEGSAIADGDLWVVPSSGGTPVRLAQVDGRLRGPVWSPDGTHIAAHYEPLAGNPSDEVWVYALSADMSGASDPTKIVLPRKSGHILAGWTLNDEIGVFVESETSEAIYTVSASGGRAVQVTPDGGGSYYPRWSPDGRRVYLRWFFGERSGHRVRDLSSGYETTAYVPATGGEPVPIPVVQSERELGLVIPGGGHSVSPDGKRIVISAAQLPWDPDEGHDIWTVPLDGGRPTRLTNDASGEAYPCWSPDGQWVAFTDEREDSEHGDSRGIYIVPARGGEIRLVTSGADSVGGGAIAFSPDGRRIAFFSGNAIKTIPVRGGRSTVLVAGVRSGRHSQLGWSSDGSKIAHDTGEGRIWITRVDAGVPHELRTGLPEGAWIGDFSWSPDGERIAFVASLGGEPEFFLIRNFLPER